MYRAKMRRTYKKESDKSVFVTILVTVIPTSQEPFVVWLGEN
jgi:hypothetical protein